MRTNAVRREAHTALHAIAGLCDWKNTDFRRSRLVILCYHGVSLEAFLWRTSISGIRSYVSRRPSFAAEWGPRGDEYSRFFLRAARAIMGRDTPAGWVRRRQGREGQIG